MNLAIEFKRTLSFSVDLDRCLEWYISSLNGAYLLKHFNNITQVMLLYERLLLVLQVPVQARNDLFGDLGFLSIIALL